MTTGCGSDRARRAGRLSLECSVPESRPLGVARAQAGNIVRA